MPKAKLETVSTTELADYLGLSSKAVAGYATSGVVKRVSPGRFLLRDSVRGYCAHQRAMAAGRSTPASIENVRLKKEQADAIALKNAITRGEYLLAADVRNEWASIIRNARATILAITARLCARLPHLTTHDVSEIDLEVREALTSMGQPK
jgi:phage terminase Nu1 subunit (DNA packaging protein)